MILLDIEGTTTPIAFVTETLFPYARARLPAFLAREGRASETAAFLAEMDRDSKSTGLKELQGRIWEEGYASGELTGVVFDDVPRAFERWHAAGIPIGIFSSGSVLAQQRLFRHSTAGDLTRFLRWHFDTAVGPKQAPSSYTRIAEAVQRRPAEIVFVSDVAGELDAARDAGMQTIMTVRPGNAPQPAHTASDDHHARRNSLECRSSWRHALFVGSGRSSRSLPRRRHSCLARRRPTRRRCSPQCGPRSAATPSRVSRRFASRVARRATSPAAGCTRAWNGCAWIRSVS